MDMFAGRLAVVTGGGAGMGADLARQLSAAGCHVAICDVSAANLMEAEATCRAGAPEGTRVTTYVADVSSEVDMIGFRDHVAKAHETDHVDLLFNNAGIGGAGYSFVAEPREQWERVFDVNWRGVYLGVRVFLPLLLRSESARIVNTSSVNGFWAGLSTTESLVAYSTAKYAVRGFSEALITDLRLRAPHVEVSVVFPGYIGTSLVRNSMTYLDSGGATPDALDDGIKAIDQSFRANAPTTSSDAARQILDGVLAGRWRILVGEDARLLDAAVRADPDAAYEPEFYLQMKAAGVFAAMPDPPAGAQ
jgi:NAD(P)-dependent dehydrogenase (short-subunit alcohol dehydrogenase family)